MEQFYQALKDLAAVNAQMLRTLLKTVEIAGNQTENNAKILTAATGLKKVIDDVLYYEKHGSPTLPKNQIIDVTTDFKN